MQTTSTGSPKVKKVTSTQPKKRGRPVGSKTIKKVQKSLEEMNTSQKEIANNVYKVHADNWQKQWDAIPDSEATVEQVKDWGRYNHDWQEGFDKGTVTGYESAQSDMKLANKITLVLTVVNVAILIILIIKNV